MNENRDLADLTDEELAVLLYNHRREALRDSGYLFQRTNELEGELRRRAGIVSEYGAPLRFAESRRRRRWWWFW